MKVQIKTATGETFLLEWSVIMEHFKVRDTSLTYIKNVVLGRAVEKPKLDRPLLIYLNKGDLIQSGIVVEIKKL